MKQLISCLLVLAIIFAPLPPPVFAQQLNQAAGTLTASSSATDNCATANACVVLKLGPSDASASITINGTFAGTETFEASASAGAQWSSISCPTFAQGATVASATATGAWTCGVAGMTTLRVRQSAFTSGGPVVSLASSPALPSIASVQTPQSLSTTSTPNFAAPAQVAGLNRVYSVTADFLTDGASTSLNPIPGLTWTLPANTALNVPFGCTIAYAQGTGSAAITIGPGFTQAPTNAEVMGFIGTNATTIATGATLITTATSAGISGTPGAQTTVFPAEIHGFIENPSQAANVVTINIKTATAADSVTIKRGSYCKLF